MKLLFSKLVCGVTSLAMLVFGLVGAKACQTPVFRYALERWEPSPYGLLVFHRGALTTNQQETVKILRELGLEEEGLANFVTVAVDLDAQTQPSVLKIWRNHSNAPLPHMVLRYPDSEPEDPSAWTAPLTPENARLLVDSPVRRETAKRISSGEAAVWLMIESGDRALDDRTAQQIEAELKKSEQTIELPPDPFAFPESQTNAIELKVGYSLLRMARTDPKEQLLLSTLFSIDEDLREAKGPIAVPVFGRGRALCALPEKQIIPEVIHEALAFLSGACSCEVKEMNPGFDLLVAADWAAAVEGRMLSDEPPPALVGLGSLIEQPKAKPTNAAPMLAQMPTTPPPPASGTLSKRILYFGGAFVLLVATLTLVVNRSRKSLD